MKKLRLKMNWIISSIDWVKHNPAIVLIFVGAVFTAYGGVVASLKQAKFQRTLTDKSQEIVELTKKNTELSEENAKLSKETLGIVSGGESFCQIICLKPELNFMLIHTGKYPVYDLSIRIVDMLKHEEYSKIKGQIGLYTSFEIDTFLKIGNIMKNSPLPLSRLSKWQDPSRDHYLFDIHFIARNGYWVQRLELRKANGKWAEASVVTRPNDDGESSILSAPRVDDNFPVDEKSDPYWSSFKNR